MDWNQEYKDAGYLTYVEAYVASWIEILLGYNNISVYKVEAYVASWIEIWWFRQVKSAPVVEAYVASWIEIANKRIRVAAGDTSRLT